MLFGQTERVPLSQDKVSDRACPPPAGSLSDILDRQTRLIIFGGKGGVGKTTIAAACALYIAEHTPDKKVLAFSTDPVHALSDSFLQHVGGQTTPIEGIINLHAVEVDGTQMLESLKHQYREDLGAAFDRFLGSGSIDVEFDRDAMNMLLSLS
ncbi:MAG: hypothetical protein NTU41_11270, partial [Chloroflexi bacterium]|nr:hypothetical protein [Chloroflexota bacterium]